MSPELERELSNIEPSWFIRGSVSHFGFDVGDGWYELLRNLLQQLKGVAPPGFEVVQVKEKWGELCFYYNVGSPKVEYLVRRAEAASRKTCMDCGRLGKPRLEPWVTVQCNSCYAVRKDLATARGRAK